MIESVAGICFSLDRSAVLLILRRDVPVWVLPGGGIDVGEEPESAIMREILEETGFRVKIKRLVGHYSPVNRLAKETHLYECEIVSGEASISNETKGVRFFALNALPPLSVPYSEWIEDARVQTAPISRKLTSVNYFTMIRYLLSHPLLVGRFLLARLGLPING